MISTYLTYRSYAADLTRSLSRISANTMVAREAQYFKDNIGSIKSVDDFMKNTRVFNYAMKAYGLEDMTNSKAFMRKVLQSDVTDTDSFVRKLTDTRFLNFAKAFNFGTDGKVATSPIIAMDADLQDDTIGLYSEQRIKKGAAAAIEAQYYQDTIGLVGSVDDLLGNQRLLSCALESVGLDPKIMSNTTLRAVLTSDLLDPDSYANQFTDTRFRDFAAAFSFSADGSVSPGVGAQTAAQVADTVYFNFEAKGAGASPAAATFKANYYQSTMPSITSVDAFLADDKLLTVALVSAGLDPSLQSKTQLREVLTSDLGDPDSVANTLPSANYRAFAAAFNFNTDGSVTSSDGAQSVTQRAQTITAYFSGYDDSAIAAEDRETSYFKLLLPNMGSIAEMQANSRVYNYALRAYGIDPTTVSKTTVRNILQSDLNNPTSFANTSRDPRFKALAAAFNFGADGLAQPAKAAQSKNAILAMAQVVTAKAGTDETLQKQAKAEATYYGQAILDIGSVDQFLQNNALVDFALNATGLENERLSDETLKKILTSDPLNLKSFVNQPENAKYRALAAAFNFDADGRVPPQAVTQAQTRTDTIATIDLYARQTLELTVGDQSEGARLALYFQRKAPEITSAYSILGDKALFQVVRTALGLPATMSNATIEVQAAAINKKLELTDLKDSKKLDKFLGRFMAMYDITNSQNSASSFASILFANR